VPSKNEVSKKADIKKITWMKSREKLVFIIRQLSDNGFLFYVEKIDFDNMIANHFVTKKDKSLNKEENAEKIKWKGSLSQLVFLIDELLKHNFLSKSDTLEKDNLINNHFEGPSGRPLKKNVIKSTRERIKNVNNNGIPKEGEKILDIIEETGKVKE
jgi:hypothetical protein